MPRTPPPRASAPPDPRPDAAPAGLSRLLALLDRPELGAAPAEIADALWLATQIDRVTPGWSRHAPAARQASDDLSPDPDPDRATASEPELGLDAKNQPTDGPAGTGGDPEHAAAVYPSTARGSRPARHLPAPGLPVLPNALALGRALRVLRRQRPSSHALELDPEATAEQYAEIRLRGQPMWQPVWRPRARPWLDLLLILDRGASMPVWQPVADALTRLLVQSGVFGRIRVLHLDSDDEPRLRSPVGGTDHTVELMTRAPGAADGHRLALILSDCIATGWYQARMPRLLEALSHSGPVLLVQPMPPRRWPDTALGLAESVTLTPRNRPGRHLPDLVPMSGPLGGQHAEAPQRAPILPTIRLDPGNLRAWGTALAGRTGSRTRGYRWPLSTADSAAQEHSPPVDPSERLAAFEAVASAAAQHLAGQLACVPYPLTLPMMRLVQQQSDSPSAGLEHLAEVFSSGLIEPHVSDEKSRSRPTDSSARARRMTLSAGGCATASVPMPRCGC